MKKLRWLFITLGVVLLLGVVGLGLGSLWLNSFIHSDSFRREVETRASQASGGTVEIKQIEFSIWNGVKLNGLATKLVSSHGTLVSQMEGVSCAYSPLALLERRLQIDSVTITNPQIILTQKSPSSITTSTTSTEAAAPAPFSKETLNGAAGPLQVVLETAKIVNGTLSIQDDTGTTKAELKGIEMTTKAGGYFRNEDVVGTLTIATIALPENVNVTNFSTGFKYREGAFSATPFQATAFGGQITGHYKLDVSGPSVLEVNATQIDMSQAGQAADPNSPTKLSGALALQSVWMETETGKPSGQGDAQIANGQLVGAALLNELATAFQLKEMSDPELKSVTTHFQFSNGTTRFSNLVIESTVFEMTGNGTIDPQGGLSADMVLTLSDEAFRQIPAVAASTFSKLLGGGGSIAFHLSGTAANPQSDTMTRLFIQSSKIHKSIKSTFDKLFQ